MMDEATARYGYVLKRLEAGMIAYRLSIPYAGRVSAEPADPRAEGIGTSDGGSRLPNAEAGSDSIADDDGRIDAARGTYGPAAVVRRLSETELPTVPATRPFTNPKALVMHPGTPARRR